MANNRRYVPGSKSSIHRRELYRFLLAGLAILASFALASPASAREPLPGQFDNYALPLSWSPTYCASNAGQNDPQQCGPGRAYAFVVHGLWPQHKQGRPEDCALRERWVPGELIGAMRDIMPSRKLIIDDWKKHGGCSGLRARAYFDLTRDLFNRLRIPARYLSPKALVITTPEQLITDFVKINRGLTPDMLSVQCGNSRGTARLTELRVCFGKDGSFQSCGANERRQCRAEQLVLPPVRQAAPAFTTKYVYYKVSGDSAAGIYVSMLKRGPHVKGAKAYAATSAESSQRGKLELTKSCRIIDYQYSVDFTIRLPKLTDKASLSASARNRWQQFSSFLRKHEETHRAIWMGCANEIETKVRALHGRTCEEVDKKAQLIRDQVQNACNRKHIAFDAAEQKKLAKHPFVKMVLAPSYNPIKPVTAKTTRLAAKKRKKSAAALVNW